MVSFNRSLDGRITLTMNYASGKNGVFDTPGAFRREDSQSQLTRYL